MNRRSLLEHFAPPPNQIGHAGWMCGFSADVVTMNAIAERFCGQGRAERSTDGRARLALLLDRHHRQIRADSVPSVVPLPAAAKEPPYRLMHAKVALLGFRSPMDPEAWTLRLIVTTGNWTQQTAGESLDLVWAIDLDAEEADVDDEDALCRRADILAAARFFDWLRRHYDDRLLSQGGVHTARFDELGGWIDVLVSPEAKPRFLDTRRAPLVAQLPERIAAVARPTRRNAIVMGSGFWEGGQNNGPPIVPSHILKVLTEHGLLTTAPEVTLVVNPAAGGTLANEACFAAMPKRWCVRAPSQPHPVHCTLHAKFVFSANFRSKGDKCSSAWLYLGSGNLTPAGFLERGRKGNLEAGIVMAIEGLQWGRHGRRTRTNEDIRHRLPIDWDARIVEAAEMEVGDEPPDRIVAFIAAAVSHLIWEPQEEGGFLRVPGAEVDGAENLNVLDSEERPCTPIEGRRFAWPGPQPTMVAVRVGDGAPTLVPVLDPFGRIAAPELDPIGIDMAIEMLLRFPGSAAPDAEEFGGETKTDAEEPSGADTDGAAPDAVRTHADDIGASVSGTPPIQTREEVRRLMRLVEAIADRQTVIREADWNAWCSRLECVLSQLALEVVSPRDSHDRSSSRSRTDANVIFARRLGLNPLAPLRHDPFRPDFAVGDGEAARMLDRTLASVERRWEVDGLEPLGGI